MRVHTALALLAAFMMAATSAQASVQISTDPTKNMNCASGVCSPTAKKAVLNVNDLAGMLASGDVNVASGSQAKDIVIAAKLSWASSHRLTLDAYRSITINRPIIVLAAGGLTIDTNDGAAGGDFRFFGKGHIEFQDLNSDLEINGHGYGLFRSLTKLARAISHVGDGHFALAKSINVATTNYNEPPIRGLSGTVEGLGNSISNLTITETAPLRGAGLIGNLSGSTATIRDLGLVAVNIHAIDNAGGFAVSNEAGVIANSYSTGQITISGSSAVAGGLVGSSSNGTYQNSFSSIDVTAEEGTSAAGGLVGINGDDCDGSHCFGQIVESYFIGSVTGGTGTAVGGLAGENSSGLIIDSYSTGSVSAGTDGVAGGLVGVNSTATSEGPPEIAWSYSAGLVSGASGSTIGGLIGSDVAGSVNTDLYWDLDTSGIGDPSQGAGNVANDHGITGLTDAQLKAGLPAGFDRKIWAQKASVNNGYPYLINNQPPQ